MDDYNFPDVTSAPGVLTSDTRDDMSEHLMVSLMRLAHELYGQTAEVGERFCHEVTTLSHGCARLFLRDQRKERAVLAASLAVYLRLPVQYGGITYGELFVVGELRNLTHLALSFESSARLAQVCGGLLHMLEEGAPLNNLGRRVDFTMAESLSDKQVDVLWHMAMGEDNEAIAHALRITATTVETHRRAIYARLGVHGLLEAVLVGHRRGLFLLIGNPSPSALPSR